ASGPSTSAVGKSTYCNSLAPCNMPVICIASPPTSVEKGRLRAGFASLRTLGFSRDPACRRPSLQTTDANFRLPFRA
ncbi:hypothetical protein, partial [Plasticicumulans lactativorans]|uniref:hypothetical protein n=1 Tax=Plasticicumulans lactativorans TaxID=1133106 RepID=UPI001A9CE292